MNDLLRIATPEGERVVPLSQVKRVLRRRPATSTVGPKAPQAAPQRIVDHAVGVELRKGDIVWSWGSSDWYYSGEPAWGE